MSRSPLPRRVRGRLPAPVPRESSRPILFRLVLVGILLLGPGISQPGGIARAGHARAAQARTPPATSGRLPAPGDRIIRPGIMADQRIWPTTSDVVREFAPPWPDWLPGHRGLDLAAGTGRKVRTPRAGVIAWRGRPGGVPVLVIRHGTTRATYQPVESKLSVGSVVLAGQVVGRLTSGGHCRRRCLHWGLRMGDRYLDPRLLLAPPRAFLVPVLAGSRP